MQNINPKRETFIRHCFQKQRVAISCSPQRLSVIGILCASALIFFLFVPVKLTAMYSGAIHEYESISDQRIKLTAHTLSGRTYEISDFSKNMDSLEDAAASVTLRWGMLSTKLQITPVPFDHYTVTYNALHYEKEDLKQESMVVSAVFEDDFVRVMDSDEYTFSSEEGKMDVAVMVHSIFGDGPAGNIPTVRFTGYRIVGPAVYEGDFISSEQYAAFAVFENHMEKLVHGDLFLSRERAGAHSLVQISSKYGSYGEIAAYIPISSVRPNDDFSQITVEYEDGKTILVKPQDKDSDFMAPVLRSCMVNGENIVVELDTDAETHCIYALFESSDDGIAGECLGACYGSGSVQITVPFKQEYMLDEFRAISVCADAKACLTASSYITNPEKEASRTFAYPKQPSKKGLQVDPRRLGEARELGVNHSVVNVLLDKLAGGSSYPYNYNGKTYYFNGNYIWELDRDIRQLGSADINTTAVLLMRYTGASADLIYPGGRVSGHSYYGLNMVDPDARDELAAMFTFLAEHYSNDEFRVYNWILGNEVGNYTKWNYCGGLSFDEYVANYAESFRVLYNCTRSVYSNSHCLISLDHCWNFTRSGAYTSREMLDAFAKEIEEHGDIEWWVAYHAYSEPLTNTRFWNTTARVVDSLDSKMITIMNLKLLTDYVADTYGEEHKFILSENGFSSSSGEEIQAAAIAYAYRLAEANDMVDSLIIHRHTDASAEMGEGLYFGLRNSSGVQKRSWTVYQNMDRNSSSTDFALDIIGGTSWKALTKRAGF